MICFLLIICSLFSHGCEKSYKKGHPVSNKKINMIAKDKPTKEDLMEIIGYPSLILNDSKWLYMTFNTSSALFGDRSISNITTLIIEFDNKDKVSKVRVVKTASHRNIHIFMDSTPHWNKNMNINNVQLGPNAVENYLNGPKDNMDYEISENKPIGSESQSDILEKKVEKDKTTSKVAEIKEGIEAGKKAIKDSSAMKDDIKKNIDEESKKNNE